jgi:hypothetical protein
VSRLSSRGGSVFSNAVLNPEAVMLSRLAPVFLILFAADGEKKVAMVLAVKGAVTLQAKDGTNRPAKVMALLTVGERLSVAADGEATLIFLGDKHRERLKANARVMLTASGCSPAEAVERQEAINPQSQVRYEDVPRLAGGGKGAAVIFRDPRLPKTPPVVTPMFGATVLTDRPALSWQPVPGVTEYQVRLVSGRLDTAGGKEKRLWTARTKEPRLPYPPKEKPLRFGRVYSWSVSARKDGEAERAERVLWESQFSVITEVEAAELARFRPLVAGDAPADLLLAALTYQEHGVYEEALALFERLAKLAPKEAPFQAALADYYERAGRREEAREALDRAKRLGSDGPLP